MEAIYAIDSKNGLSKNGTIPWKSKQDMQFFKNKTINNVVIMGKNTYNSLPKSVRPLCNRLNIVLTNNAEQYSEETKDNPNVIFTNDDTIHTLIENHREVFAQSYPGLQKEFKIFIIGGKSIYEQFLPLCTTIWVTKLKQDHDCDLFFDYDFSAQFEAPEIVEDNEEFTIYKYTKTNTI